MRFSIIFACCLLTFNQSFAQTGNDVGDIIFYDNDQDENGYNFKFKTSNGIEREETGRIETVDGVQLLKVQGTSKHIAPDNTEVEVSYTADENGYRPKIFTRISTAALKSLGGR